MIYVVLCFRQVRPLPLHLEWQLISLLLVYLSSYRAWAIEGRKK